MIIINSIKKTALLAGGLFLSALSVNADDVQKTLYNGFFKSPEAMSFQRQGQFQVGEYTGTPNISFPLHTIKYKDIELPINLSYNSSGVQVAAEASWVGLNWDLNVGGCINLIPCGGVDALYPSVDSLRCLAYNEILNKRKETDYYLEYNTNPKDKPNVLPYDIVNDGLRGLTESDIYSVSLPSSSFFFYIDRQTGIPEIIGADCKNIVKKITVDNNEAWKIIDGNGYTYIFGCPDRNSSQGTNGKSYTSAWFLTKITSPHGFVLSLNYTTKTNISLEIKMSEQTSFYMETLAWAGTPNAVSPDKNASHTKNWIANNVIGKKYLESITAGNQKILFSLSDRKDLDGGKKLDCISIKSDNAILKKIYFDYDYFESNKRGGDYLVQYNGGIASSDYSKLRLKLKSFYYESANKEVSDIHSFEYKEDKGFPSKNSFAVDMWGYYNGQENKIDGRYTFCPAPKFCDIDEDTYDKLRTHKGANRFADPDYVDALSLKKITYPTKGYTEFTFESNTFMKQYQNPEASGRSDIVFKNEIQVQDVNFVNNSRNNYATGPEVKRDFTLDRATKGVLTVKIDAGSLHLSDLDLVSSRANVTLMYKAPNQPYVPLQKITISTSSDISKISTFEKEINVKLPAGDYMFWAELPSHIKQETGASVIGTLTYNVIPESIANGGGIQTFGGGIRIRSIKNYDSDNTLLEETDYEYINEDGYSSGKHILPHRFYKHQIKYNLNSEGNQFTEGGACALSKDYRFQIFDNPLGVISFVSAIHNNNIGYSRVVKKTKNANRVQVSTYRNEALDYNLASALQVINEITGKKFLFKRIEICTQIKPQNGNLLTQEIFDNNEQLVHRTENKYSYTSQRKKVNFSVEQEGITNMSDDLGFLPLLVTCYSFENYWIYQKSAVSTDYANGIPTTQKETTYLYNPINHQVSQIDENTSIPGQIRSTKIKYSVDLTDNVGTNMKKANRLNDVVENKIVQVENGVEKMTLSTQQTKYSQYYPYLPISQLSSIGSYSPEVRAQYLYDAKKNVRSIVIDGMETVYVWSYNGQYPIAKIEGLTYSAVESAIGASTITSLLSEPQPTASDLSTMRTKINAKGGYITTYTYKPLVGILSETQPNGNTIYYEYDSFGRLKNIKDYNKKIIKTYEYHYSDKK